MKGDLGLQFQGVVRPDGGFREVAGLAGPGPIPEILVGEGLAGGGALPRVKGHKLTQQAQRIFARLQREALIVCQVVWGGCERESAFPVFYALLRLRCTFGEEGGEVKG